MTGTNKTRNPKSEIRNAGSAIILAVVLTSLLAIIGVIFLLSSRVDSVATSGIADNKDLNLAVDTVVARISEVLAADVPGGLLGGEYYDYPDANNVWLACLEPYLFAAPSNYRWRHISDLYGVLDANNLAAVIVPDYQPMVIAGDSADADGDGVTDSIWVEIPTKTSAKGKPIYAAIRIVDNSAMLNVNTGYKFDPNTADGSSQMQINLMALSWRPIVSSYSITDESDLRVARAPVSPANLSAYERDVIWQYGFPAGSYTPFDISDELEMRYRFLLNQKDTDTRLDRWGGEFRNSWVSSTPFQSRSEWFRTSCIDANLVFPPDPNYAYRHIATIQNLDRIIDPNGVKMLSINSDPKINPNNTRKIIADTLVAGGALPADANTLSAQITANLIDYVDSDNEVTIVNDDGNNPFLGFEQPCVYISELAQNFFEPDANDPCIIERAYAIEFYKPYPEDLPPGPNEWRLVISGIPPIDFTWTGSTRFHVFLNDAYNRINVDFNDFTFSVPSPFNGEIVDINDEPNLVLQWNTIPSATSYNIYLGTDQNAVFVATPNDVGVFQGNVSASVTTFDPPPLDVNTTYFWRIEPIGPGIVTRGLVWRFTVSQIRPFYAPIEFDEASVILLQRKVPGLGGDGYVTVDTVFVPLADTNAGWLDPSDPNDPNARFATHSFQRDIFPHKPIRRLWDIAFGFIDLPSVGTFNSFVGDPPQVQAHPANSAFTNVGEFGQLFYRSTYDYGGVGPWIGILEPDMRVNLALPMYQQIFNYLTVIDPFDHIPDANETRIKGRININTAPWYVLAQLPWVTDGTPSYELAQAIVAYRDKLNLLDNVVDYSGGRGRGIVDLTGGCPLANVREAPGFAAVGELMNVTHALGREICPPLLPSYNRLYDIRKYAEPTSSDLNSMPDLSPNDGAINDFEERDMIFSRISNLVTVRSDIFTTYILVRIGKDGPQKRIVAILDRSNVFPNSFSPGGYSGEVKIIATYPVADPR